MKLLIIGARQGIASALAQSALLRGHDVTLYQPQRLQHPDWDSMELLHDQKALYQALSRQWPLVIDCSSHSAEQADWLCEHLNTHSEQLILLSSLAVYRSQSSLIDEHAARAEHPQSLAEQTLYRYYGKAMTTLRLGGLAGPKSGLTHFNTLLAAHLRKPAPPEPLSAHPVQYIDVRDAADFALFCGERGDGGVFNLASEHRGLDSLDLYEAMTRFAALEPELEGELISESRRGISLWYLDGRRFSVEKAVCAGLNFRSLQETLEDSCDYLRDLARQGYRSLSLT